MCTCGKGGNHSHMQGDACCAARPGGLRWHHRGVQLTAQHCRPCRLRRAVRAGPPQPHAVPLVKVCGVTSAEDATMAAQLGADFIGMIMWPRAKRSVGDDAAAAIAAAARAHGARPVGVFVDEDGATIGRRCAAAGIDIAQLHGQPARDALPDIPPHLQVVYVVHADAGGAITTPLPSVQPPSRPIDWLLVDGLQGGSGQTFDWSALRPPSELARQGWLLAGGLGPDNVGRALQVTQAVGVDVSSGVCGADGLAKDQGKVAAFIDAARAAALQPADNGADC